MKKHLILSISLCLLLGLNVNGQFLKKLLGTMYVRGIVVLNSGDTLKGDINFSDAYGDYQVLVMRDTLNKNKLRYHPQDIRYFSIDSMLFYPKLLKRDSVFMQLLVNDSLKIYKYRYLVATAYYSATETSFIYEKPDGKLLQVLSSKLFPFKKRVGEFFKDDPELSEKILNKTYKFDDLYVIANEYNTWLKRKF
jgi:hypothetical protein